MTAPERGDDPETVRVALGERAYDIVIGRGILPSLGRRIVALKPGARAAIVADDARSANNANCSPMRFSASPRAQ